MSGYTQKALGYCQGVLTGFIPAGPFVRLACDRQIKDLERWNSGDADWPYYFDVKAAERVCTFVESMRHTKGKWAAKQETIKLEPWQCFLLTTLFGWKRWSDGTRRFRRAYWEIPRKNGKSIIAAAVGIYMLSMDGEHGAEVYSGATTEKQAWEVFRPAREMMRLNEDLREFTHTTVAAKALLREEDGGKFEPLVGNPGDGSSPSCAIIDEFHEHATPALIDTMETGMGAREQPILLAVTTAGFNIVGPCYDRREDLVKTLERSIDPDEELFGIIFGIDVGDDWADPSVLIKANPNYGISVMEDFLLSQQRAALRNPVQQSKFKTKHLNEWVSTLTGVINLNSWNACEDKDLTEAEVADSPSWIAIDLASKLDLCARCRVYRREIGGKPHFYLFYSYWLPEDAIEAPGPNQAIYKKWVIQGYLTPTDGATIDFEMIAEDTIAEIKRQPPEEMAYDPFNATAFVQKVQTSGFSKVVEFTQTPQNFVVPLDELQSAIHDGRVHHTGNPITTWCMSNMVAKPAKKGMTTFIKKHAHLKIDGATATVMGIARATATDAEEEKKFQMIIL